MIKKVCTTRRGGCVKIGKNVTASYAVASVANNPSDLLYVWVTLTDGRKMCVFFNRETNLLVVDVTEKGGRMGHELIRRNLPSAMTKAERAELATQFRNERRREQRREGVTLGTKLMDD